MDLHAIKDKLKTILYGFDKMEDEPTADANKVYQESELNISEKQVGGKVEIINGDGTLAPIPDGSYEMSTGDKFDVKDGLITKWNDETEAPVVDEPVQEMADEEKQSEGNDWKAEVDALKAETEMLKAMIEELKSAIGQKEASEQAMSAQFNAKLDELNSNLKALASVPAEFSKTTQSNIVKDANYSNLEKIKREVFGIK